MTEIVPSATPDDPGEFLLSQSEDGQTRIDVRLSHETLWLSQRMIVDLFQVSLKTANEHLANIYAERELDPTATIRKFRIVQTEGNREVSRTVDHYNLEAILAVGYRVRTHRGTQFRVWATERLREDLVRGFAMDDARLKRAGGGNYFDELLARIRDIRSSERVFWRKVLDINSTSIDYDPKADSSLRFFEVVYNKMHWAAHGHTAAEVIHLLADASQPNMGLTTWDGDRPRKTDVTIAKNYLLQDEIEALNRIATEYVEFAELEALNRKPMSMVDWFAKLDNFLKLFDREILTQAWKISHDAAQEKAEAEFARFKAQPAALPQAVDEHFAQSLAELRKIESQAKAKKTVTHKPAPQKKGTKKPRGKPHHDD